MAVVNKYTRLYYYYLCIFIFKNKFLGNSYTELVPLNKLIFSYSIRSHLLYQKNRFKSIKLVNTINKFNRQVKFIYKYLYKTYILFSNLIKVSPRCEYFTMQFAGLSTKTDFIKIQYIMGYLSFMRNYSIYGSNCVLLRRYTYLLYEYVLHFHKYMHRFSFILSYRSLLLNKYRMHKLYISSIIPLYKKSHLFYILLCIGLQHNYKTYPFYSHFYSLMLQYNYLLSDLRLVKLLKKIILRKKKKRRSRDFSKDTFFKCISSKYNNYSLRVYVLFNSTKSNSRITITLNNIVLYRLSCGSIGYKKSSRSTYLAANQLGFMLSKMVRKLLLRYLSNRYNFSLFKKKNISLPTRDHKLYFNKRTQHFYKRKFLNRKNIYPVRLASQLTPNFPFTNNKKLKYACLHTLYKTNKYLQFPQIRTIYHRKIIPSNVKSSLVRSSSIFPNFQICINYTGSGIGRKASFKPINSGLYWLKRNINTMRWKTRKARSYFSHKLFHKLLRKRYRYYFKKSKRKIKVLSKRYHYYFKKFKQKINFRTANISSLFNSVKKGVISTSTRCSRLLKSIRLNVHNSNTIRRSMLENIDYFEYHSINYIISEFFTVMGVSYILTNLVYYSVKKDRVQYLGILKIFFDLFYFNKISNSLYNIYQLKYLRIVYLLFKITFSFNFCFIFFGILLKGTLVVKSTILSHSIFNFVIYLFNYLSKVLGLYLSLGNGVPSMHFVYECLSLYHNMHYSEIANLSSRLKYCIHKLLTNSYLVIEGLGLFIKRNILLLFRLAASVLRKRYLLQSARTNRLFYSFFTPLQVSNYIHLTAKSISRPHNGCRPRKLRRK